MPRNPLPVIVESAQELLELRRGERNERRRERLHLLWLLASGTAKDRQSAAGQLGRNRQTLSGWLNHYAQGGLEAMLRAPKPSGPESQGGIGLAEPVKEAIRARLAAPQGERGYLALWQWARAEHAVTYSYSHFANWVHDQLGARLKVARKSHGEKKTQNSSLSATRA